MVKGWDIGITAMELGEKAILTIRSDYGYGQRDRGSIPPGSTMIFTVELLQINGRKSEIAEYEELIDSGVDLTEVLDYDWEGDSLHARNTGFKADPIEEDIFIP